MDRSITIGGKVGINKDTAVELTDERSVGPVDLSLKRALLKDAAMWSKYDRLFRPLEIQTNGGVIGIKG